MLIPITISEEGVLVELLYSVIQRQNQLSFQSKIFSGCMHPRPPHRVHTGPCTDLYAVQDYESH